MKHESIIDAPGNPWFNNGTGYPVGYYGSTQSVGFPPILQDHCDHSGAITKRLLTIMKKGLRALGDRPSTVAIDGAQFLDDAADKEDPSIESIKEMNLDVCLIERKQAADNTDLVKNRFCIMVGMLGKIVIGVY